MAERAHSDWRSHLAMFFIVGFGVFSFPLSLASSETGSYVVRLLPLLFGLLLLLYRLFIKKVWVIQTEVVPFLLFLGLYSYRLYIDSTVLGLNFGQDVGALWLRYFSMVLLPFLLLSSLGRFQFDEARLRFWLAVICSGALLNAVFQGYSYRLSGNSILNPITLGGYAGLLMAISLIMIEKCTTRSGMLINAALIVLGAVTLALTLSRGPILATVITSLLILWNNISKTIFSKILSLTIFSSVCYFIYINLISNFLAGSRMVINLDEESGEARLFLWIRAFELIQRYPILGSATTTENGYVHNVFLEAILACGMIGFFFFVVPTLRLSLSVIENRKKHKSGLSAVSAGFLFNTILIMFSGTVYNSDQFWVFLALLINNRASKRPEDE